MLTGINFSPPLYFVFNFLIQLIFPTSIEQLRIQSLIFIITGIILSFLLTRNIFGYFAAFFATILVASQSNLLLSQAQEARHYAMFFACGACVLYTLSLNEGGTQKTLWLTFLAHFCLCQIHYLGIIFSSLVGLSLIISRREIPIFKRIPFSILAAWILILPIYLFLLSQQSSHLGNWPKPNQLSDLLASYSDSVLILTILLPLFVLIINKLDKRTKTRSIEEIQCSRPIIITSFLWFSVPFIFWALSHHSSINLFVDRYFIPKEVAIIVIVASSLKSLYEKSNIKCTNFVYIPTTCICIFLVGIQVKRFSYMLNPTHNYHSKLIINDKMQVRAETYNFNDDPTYFPNQYIGEINCKLVLMNENLLNCYQNFSKRIHVKLAN